MSTTEKTEQPQDLPVYTLTAPEGTTAQIEEAYATIPPVVYEPPPDRWRNLRETERVLAGGKPILRVVMLGDSIVADTSRSQWDTVLQQSYPDCRIMKVTVVRGSTGCWWYRENNRVHVYVYPHRPDLLILGGINVLIYTKNYFQTDKQPGSNDYKFSINFSDLFSAVSAAAYCCNLAGINQFDC